MTVTDLNKDISGKKTKPLYLFYGEEDFLMNQKLRELKSIIVDPAFEEFNYFTFEGKSFNTSEAADAVEGFPQMSQSKLVVFKNTEILKGTKSSVTEFYESIIKSLPDYTKIIIIENEIDNRKSTLKTLIESIGALVYFPYLKPNQLELWLDDLFTIHKKRILTSDVNYIISICPPSMATLRNEFDKLLNLVGEREKITRADIDAVIAKSVEFKVFNMLDDIVYRKKQKIYTSLKEMKDTKEPPTVILGLIVNRLSDILMVKNFKSDGFSSGDMKQFFEPNKQFLVQKSLEQSQYFQDTFLRRMIEKGLDYDYSIKTGKINDYTAIELYITELIG